MLLDAKVEVEIEWCDVTVHGFESFGEARNPLMVPLAARVCDARTLPVGTTTLPCQIELPSHLSSSHSGPGSRIVYEVIVHASVPWWPDARAHFALNVRAPAQPAESIEGVPRICVSRLEGPLDGTPYAELSIGSDVVEVGGVIDGSVAMRDVGSARTTISLVAYEKSRSTGASQRVGRWTIPLGAPTPGQPITFAFGVPPDVTPTLTAGSFMIEYWLVAAASNSLRELISAPVRVRIVPKGMAGSSERVVAPHVGDARLEELFTAVGAEEGATVEPGPTLVIRRGAVVARATRELRSDGTRLAVRITYAPLHLRLEVHEPALVAFARKGRRTAKRAGLSPRCVVSARDEAQAAAFLAPLALQLTRARSIDMGDTELRYAVPSSANDRVSVGRVVREMRALVDALAAPPPLPTVLAGASAEWTELARALAGELEPGHARVVASTSEAAIDIATLFDEDGAPCGTAVSTKPTRELRIDAPITLVDENALPTSLGISAEARAALERVARFGRVSVDALEIRVTMAAPLGPTMPAARGREIVEASLRLAAALRPMTGPFR